jgi:DUF4097 and DUF4098 domain-containing protein YvlB
MIRSYVLAAILGTLMLPGTIAFASTPVNEVRPADMQGSVEVDNVAGSVHIEGWDKAEVEVTGSFGQDVERVEVTGGGLHTSVRVVQRSSHSWNSESGAKITVHVPMGSSLSCKTVSADLKVNGVRGESTLKTVSGDMLAEVGGDVNAHAVSGNIRLKAPAAKSIEVDTVSGDADVVGGDAEVQVTTVSGSAKVKLASTHKARFQTVSGSLTASLALGADARIEAQSVSGDLDFNFPAAPVAAFDLQTFSGSIDNCFGPKPAEPRHGPGSSLSFKTGEGGARLRANTHSGGIKICVAGS